MASTKCRATALALTLAGGIAVLAIGTQAALAQSKGDAAKAKGTAAKTKGDDKPRSEELDFEGDVVETSFLKPDASLVEGEARKGGASLLKIRRDFIREIVRSAEDI